MGEVESLRAEVSGTIRSKDVHYLFPFRVVGEIEPPDRAHGTHEFWFVQQGFLRLGDMDYAAEFGDSFQPDTNKFGGGLLRVDLLKPLLHPEVAGQQLTELERHPDESLAEGSPTTSASA